MSAQIFPIDDDDDQSIELKTVALNDSEHDAEGRSSPTSPIHDDQRIELNTVAVNDSEHHADGRSSPTSPFVTPIARKQLSVKVSVVVEQKQQPLVEQKQHPVKPLVEQKEEKFKGTISKHRRHRRHHHHEKIPEDTEDIEAHEDHGYATPVPKTPAPPPPGLLGPVTRRLLGPDSAFQSVTKKIKQMLHFLSPAHATPTEDDPEPVEEPLNAAKESMGEKYNERLQQAKDEINKTIRVGERVTIWNPSRVEGAAGDRGNDRIEGTIVKFSEHEFTVQLDSGVKVWQQRAQYIEEQAIARLQEAERKYDLNSLRRDILQDIKEEGPPGDMHGAYCEGHLQVGTEVIVVKEGSSKYGRRASVTDPEWRHGMVKVNMDGDVKSYDIHMLRLAPELEEEGLQVGTEVMVIKEGSSKYGRHAIVTDPDWQHGMVKVNMDGDIKSYDKTMLKIVAPPDKNDKLKVGDEVIVVKKGSSKYGRRAIVTIPDWQHGMVKVNMDGDIKSYERSMLELAPAAENAANDEPLPKGWTEEIEKITGTTYYYNNRTGESVWERPKVAAGELRDDCALIIMNMQRDFFASVPHPYDAEAGNVGDDIVLEHLDVAEGHEHATTSRGGKFPVRDSDECLENINILRKKYPFKMTIHCRSVRPYNHCSFVSSHPGLEEMMDVRVGEDRVMLYPDHCIDGTLGSDFHPDMVTNNDIVLEVGGRPSQNDFSPFKIENKSQKKVGKAKHYKTKPLASLLMRNKIRQVYVVGIGLGHAVQDTALDCKETLPKDVDVFIVNGCILPMSKKTRIAACKQRLSVAGVRETDLSNMDWEMEKDPKEKPLSRAYQKLTASYSQLDLECGWEVEKSASQLQEMCQSGNMEDVYKMLYSEPQKGTYSPSHIGLKTGMNVLHFAVLHGHLKLIKFLTDLGQCMDPNARTMFGDTPLILAVRHRQRESIKMLLLQKTIAVDAQDSHGRTALIWAVLNRDIESIIRLLDKHANVNLAANCKKTPVMFAATLCQDEQISGDPTVETASVVEIMRLLLNHATRRDPKSADWTRTQRKRLQACMVRRDEAGWAALHLAAKSNLLAQCTMLSIDIPINIMTDRGSQALHIAAWNGREATVLYLLQGPDNRQWHPALRSNLKLPSGHTPMDLAIIKSQFMCVNLMLSAPHSLTCFANVCVHPPPRPLRIDNSDSSSSEHRHGVPYVSLQELLHTLILKGQLQPVHGLLQFDENRLMIDGVLLNITRQIKYRCTCTFSFTNYTHPIRQYMYQCHTCTEIQKKARKSKDTTTQDASLDPVLVCLVCKDECHKGHDLTLAVDPSQDGEITHYCQCTKSTCAALSRMGNVHTYRPKPIDTRYLDKNDEFISPESDVVLLGVLLARNSHRIWCANKKEEGFYYGPKTDPENKMHSHLLAFGELPPADIIKNVKGELSNLKIIRHFGYQITRDSGLKSLRKILGQDTALLPHVGRALAKLSRRKGSIGDKPLSKSISKGSVSEPGEPFKVKDVVLSRGVLSMVNFIAQNSHEVWAKNKMLQGFVHGKDVNSLGIKQSPSLVPYDNLPAKERAKNRDTARQMLKTVFSLQFRVIPPKNPKRHSMMVTSTPQTIKKHITTGSDVKRKITITGEIQKLRNLNAKEKKFDPKKLLNLFLVKVVKDAMPNSDTMISDLIQAGANIDCHDEYQHTPVYIAAKRGNLRIVKKLVEKKASIEKSDRNGLTALSIAAYLGNMKMCRLLVGFGASLSTFDKQQFTPLHHAAKNGHSDVCRLLASSIGFAIERENRRLATKRNFSRRFRSSIGPAVELKKLEPGKTDRDLLKRLSSDALPQKRSPPSAFMSIRTRRASSFLISGRKKKILKDKYEFARRMALHGTLSQPRLTMKVTSGAPLSKEAFRAARAAIGLGDERDLANDNGGKKRARGKSKANWAEEELHSPLCLAIEACEQNCVQILLDADFDPVVSRRKQLSAYDSALLLYHNFTSKAKVISTDDSVLKSNQKMKDKVVDIVDTLNQHPQVKQIRNRFALQRVMSDLIPVLVFVSLLIFCKFPFWNAPREDTSMLFEMNSKMKEHYLEKYYDETTHGIITRDKWWEIFNETLVRPFPHGLLGSIKPGPNSSFAADKPDNMEFYPHFTNGTGVLLNSEIVAVGDIILSQVVRVPSSCKTNDLAVFHRLKQSLSSASILHEEQKHQFSHQIDEDLPDLYQCFDPPGAYEQIAPTSELVEILSSSDADKRRQQFMELQHQKNKMLKHTGDDGPPVGWISHRTSSVRASTMFWNPETEFLFEIEFKWFFSSNGILRSDLDFRGIQFKAHLTPSPVFSCVLLINMIFVISSMCLRIRQRERDNPKKQIGGKSVPKCRCCRQLQGRDYMAVILIIMQLFLIMQEAITWFLGLFANDFGEVRSIIGDVLSKIPFWYCRVKDPNRQLLCTMTKIHELENIVIAVMLLLYGMQILFSFRLVPKMGSLVISFILIFVDPEVLMYMGLWLLVHVIFGLTFHSLLSSSFSRYSTGFGSTIATFETGLNLGSLFLENVAFNEADMDDGHLGLDGYIFAGALLNPTSIVVTIFYFTWMIISVVMVNLLIGIITERYPQLQEESKSKWETTVTTKMALEKKRSQTRKGQQGERKATLKKSLQRVRGRLRLLRGIDGYKFWREEDSSASFFHDDTKLPSAGDFVPTSQMQHHHSRGFRQMEKRKQMIKRLTQRNLMTHHSHPGDNEKLAESWPVPPTR